jgi:hypothetical protein
MHEYLAAFEAAGRREGVLFIGRAQEKNTVFRTEKRRAADGRSYPWIVRTTSVVNQFYVHCVDEDFGAFFIKFTSYFPYGGKLLINGHHYAQVDRGLASGWLAYRWPDGSSCNAEVVDALPGRRLAASRRGRARQVSMLAGTIASWLSRWLPASPFAAWRRCASLL